MSERDNDSIPSPVPWYRTSDGRAALAAGLCAVIGVTYTALEYMVLPWFVDRTAALVLFVSILTLLVVSGQALTRAFGRQRH
ncbi:MAG: hypothetical protein ABEJ05_09835 [Haloglomus sp.]